LKLVGLDLWLLLMVDFLVVVIVENIKIEIM
jgi:hypothetical protein